MTMLIRLDSRRRQLAAQRGVLVARGAVSLLFALFVLLWPHITVRVIVLTFAAYLVLDGGLALWSAWRLDADERGRPASAVLALIECVAGLMALALPHRAAPYVAAGVGLWAVATGLLVLAGTLLFWRQAAMRVPLLLGSLLLCGLGIMLVIDPFAALRGVDGVPAFIAAVAAIAGALALQLAYTIGQAK